MVNGSNYSKWIARDKYQSILLSITQEQMQIFDVSTIIFELDKVLLVNDELKVYFSYWQFLLFLSVDIFVFVEPLNKFFHRFVED